MSILIKGIDMPATPKAIVIYPNGTIIDGDKKGTKILKAKAIQIPTPHGRIIDEDEIYEQPHCGECNDATLDAIMNAPTILEEEK